MAFVLVRKRHLFLLTCPAMRKERKHSLREIPNGGRLARAHRAQQAVINTYAYSPHQEGAKAQLTRDSEWREACESTTCAASRNLKHNLFLFTSSPLPSPDARYPLHTLRWYGQKRTYRSMPHLRLRTLPNPHGRGTLPLPASVPLRRNGNPSR